MTASKIRHAPRSAKTNSGISSPPIFEFRLPEPNDMNRYSNWEIDFRQIDAGAMETRVLLRPGAHVTLLEIGLPRSVHQQGCSPGDAVTLGLPTSSLRYWNGKELDSPCLVNFGSGREFDCVNSEDFNGLTISISRPFLTRLCDRMGLPCPDDFLRQSALPLRRLSQALVRLQEDTRSRLEQPGTPFGDAEQEDLVAGLICAAANAETFDDRSASRDRAKSVRRAVDFIETQAGENPLISDICAAARVSWRTLDRGFKEQFSIGPKAYLNRLRLVRARSELLRMRDGASVADVANAWGFWHMGQFARDYFRMFGERPSDTFHRPKPSGQNTIAGPPVGSP